MEEDWYVRNSGRQDSVTLHLFINPFYSTLCYVLIIMRYIKLLKLFVLSTNNNIQYIIFLVQLSFLAVLKNNYKWGCNHCTQLSQEKDIAGLCGGIGFLFPIKLSIFFLPEETLTYGQCITGFQVLFQHRSTRGWMHILRDLIQHYGSYKIDHK